MRTSVPRKPSNAAINSMTVSIFLAIKASIMITRREEMAAIADAGPAGPQLKALVKNIIPKRSIMLPNPPYINYLPSNPK